MSDWCWCCLSVTAVLLICLYILSRVSERVDYLLKFIYLYSAYIAVSFLLCVLSLPHPRDPKNGVRAAGILKYIHSLVPLSFEIQGQDLLKCPTAAVVVINHQSSIDLMSLFEIWPLLEHAGPIAKRELLYIQPFGLACWLCGAEFINRRSKTSHQDINDMGSRAKSEGKKLIIFPEGTRNGAKGLSMLPFKKGAFHIAIDGQLPILPVVISEYDFLDARKMIFRPGKVTIKVLPRIETSGYTKDSIDDLVSLTRNSMIETLKEISKTKSE